MAQVTVKDAVIPEGATAESRPDLFGTRGQFAPDGKGGLVTFMNAGDKPEFASPEASKIEQGFYVGDRGLPWHVTLARQLGSQELMTDAGRLLTASEALIAAGSFEVEKAPIYVNLGNGLTEVPNRFATYRTDTKAPLGVVGRSYKILQEKELAEFADYIVDQGGHIRPVYETGGHMYGGARFFLSMELSGLDLIVPGDPSELQTYLLVWTSHDGSKPAYFQITHVRAVCRNTLDLAARGAIKTYRVRHTGSLEGKVAAARDALGIALKTVESIKGLTEKLALTTVIDSQVREIFEKTWPTKAAEGDEVNERASRHVERALANYGESTTLDGIRGTAWGALQAGTEYVDHLVPVKARRYDPTDVRAESLLMGAGHDAKERLLRATLAVAK